MKAIVGDYYVENEVFVEERNLVFQSTLIERVKQQMAGSIFGELRDRLRAVMIENTGVFRDKSKLHRATNDVRNLRQLFKSIRFSSKSRLFNIELIQALELDAMIDLASIIAEGALRREESRGAHTRIDFPKRNDRDWLKHTIATRGPSGEPLFTGKPVECSTWEPVERTY